MEEWKYILFYKYDGGFGQTVRSFDKPISVPDIVEFLNTIRKELNEERISPNKIGPVVLTGYELLRKSEKYHRRFMREWRR